MLPQPLGRRSMSEGGKGKEGEVEGGEERGRVARG